ncbi:MAG: CotH kinase family protein [Bacteroidaceae bacterium]|nr:CotH kinase family protein [Bacteroidaceae bacterium]
MTRYLQFLAFVLTALAGSLNAVASSAVEPVAGVQDTTFVYMPNGRLDVFPPDVVKNIEQDLLQVVITTIDGKEYTYLTSSVQSISNTAPADKPLLTSYKFNNKFNANLYADVLCEFGADGLITGSVPTIGKWLCPSFQRSDDAALVYVGRKPQHSKVTRLSFAEPVDYVVTRSGWQVMQLNVPEEEGDEKPDPEPEPQPVIPELDSTAVKLELTADMLSTNAPTMRTEEDLPSLIDGNEYSFFHSTWSGSGYETLPLDSCPWIEVHLPEAVHRLQFRYETRSADQRWPLALRLDVSKDGQTWTAVEEFTSEADGLPEALLQWWTSPVMDLDDDYQLVRVVCTQAAYKNYLCMAELEFYKVDTPTQESDPIPEPNPVLPEGATLNWQPYGTRYTVSVDFPADRAAGVPVVYITTDEGILPPDKTNYLTGTIIIDGAGVFPDMEETDIQIRGRGNSSWAGQRGKSPYRVKFGNKQKPFGLKNGKNWVLLANKQTGSMMSNAIGMKVAQLAGAAGANHIIPVDLYINDEYRGSYNWTEQVAISNNSIDLDDENYAAMLELDSYYDEPYRFRAYNYNMPCNIKFPDFDDDPLETALSPEAIEDDWNDLIDAVSMHRDISNFAQVDTLAAFYLTNEFILNQELMHPKSTFVYKERVGDSNDLWKFGPVWDLDWAFGYEGSSRYYQSGAEDDLTTRRWMECNDFWIDLRQCGENFDRTYYLAWTRLLKLGAVEELQEFIDSYYNFANASFQSNAEKWGDGWDYSSNATSAKSWLKRRANAIYKRLTAYDAEELLELFEEWKPFGVPEEPEQLDRTPYIRVREAVNTLLASTDSYRCQPATLEALQSVITEQDAAIIAAETSDDVVQTVRTLRMAVVQFLSASELEIRQPLDLSNILVNNPSPVENINGWYATEEPNSFHPATHTADFLDQPGAEIYQSVYLPAGDFEWTGIAVTRSGATAQLFVDGTVKRLTTASTLKVNSHEDARAWFDKGNGVNTIAFSLDQPSTKMLGLRADVNNGDHWLVWSDFYLKMTGKNFYDDAIRVPETSTDFAALASQPVFDLTGRRLSDRFDQFFRSAPRQGIYLVGGHKVRIGR